MITPRAATTVRKTPNFDFIFGRYSHSNAVIPYFQVSMSFGDVAQYLKLVNEMPGAASMNWRVEELFQRDIDWGRVERKIVPYLKQQNDPQFFNSLTIALLPIRSNVVGTFDPDELWNAPLLDSQENFAVGKIERFGPISCGFWSEWTSPSDDGARLGQLCWNAEQVCAVAIDGQHRLAAIKHLASAGSEAYRTSSVPVILIVLDPKLGFSGGRNRDSLVDVLRRLFIDLNKHAQKVSRARQILLDDRDPASICVRRLVGSELTRGKSELDACPPILPLTLVDWHSEQGKFDVGPYLTTILGTDWAVAKLLGIRPFEDPIAFDEIERLIGRLESALSIQLNDARLRLEECRRFERPFVFVEEPVNELKLIGDGFQRRWASAMIKLLTQLSPYRELVLLRSDLNTLTPEFANWFALRSGADSSGGGGRASQILEEYQRHLSNRDDDPVAISDYTNALEAFRDLKDNHELAYTVVFQRALILAFLQFKIISRRMVEELHPGTDVDLDSAIEFGDLAGSEADDGTAACIEETRACELVAALNALIAVEPEILKVDFEFPRDQTRQNYDRFWLGSFVQPAGPIDFTQGASKRASDLLLLIGIFWLYQREEGLGRADFDGIMERANSAEGGVDSKLSQCLKRLYGIDQSVAGRILKSREQEDDDDQTLAKREIYDRARWLWMRLAS